MSEIIEADFESKQLAVRKIESFMPVMNIEQATQRYNAVVSFAKKIMKDGRDYGVIPGTERKGADGEMPSAKNNVLLKPGAEKLCTLFGLVPDFESDECIKDFDRGIFHFSYRCVLLRNARREIVNGKPVITGDVAGTGIGSCNSREKKYRRGGRSCPACGALAIKRSKFPPREDPNAEPGWYCYAKANGCGANFAADDPEIVNQGVSFDPNEAADLVNTMQKMAQKRSLVAATLIATNASEFFTQDLELEDEQEERPRSEGQRNEPPLSSKFGNGKPKTTAPTQQQPAQAQPQGKRPQTPAEKAAFFRSAIPTLAHEHLAKWRASILAQGFEQETLDEILLMWFKRAIAISFSSSELDGLVKEFESDSFNARADDFADLRQACNDRRIEMGWETGAGAMPVGEEIPFSWLIGMATMLASAASMMV